MAGHIVIGTSSWADPGFVEEWYPDGLPPRERLPYYVKLHRLLSRDAARPSSLPKDLRSRARTNERGRLKLTKRLEAAVADRVLEGIEPLGDKLATFLMALTPGFGPRDHKLDELAPLVERLSAVAPVVIELRNRFWLDARRVERTLGWRMMFNNNRGADAPQAAQRMRELLSS